MAKMMMSPLTTWHKHTQNTNAKYFFPAIVLNPDLKRAEGPIFMH